MSTENERSSSPASSLKRGVVSWLTSSAIAAGDYYMAHVKSVLESHVYVLAILSTRDTDLSTYIADVQSACNSCAFFVPPILVGA